MRPLSDPLGAAAVVWDYDGTLVDTRGADEAAVALLLEADPGAATGTEIFWALEGRPIIERIDLAWPGRADELLPLFDRPIPPRIFPGIVAAIDELRRRRMPMAVVSSRRVEALAWGLRACRLRSAFTAVVGLEDVVAPKPDPEGLLLACDELGVSPKRAVYIGDSQVDVEAGHRAAMAAWRATWAHRGPAARSPVELCRPEDVLARLRAHARGEEAPPLAAAG